VVQLFRIPATSNKRNEQKATKTIIDMKKAKFVLPLFAVLAAISSMVVLTSCNTDHFIKPSKNIISRQVEVKPFNGLSVEGSLDVVFRQGPATSVVVKGSDNLVPLVAVKSEGGTLVIRMKREMAYFTSLSLQGNVPRRALVVYVTSPDINNVQLNGSGDINVGNLVCSGDMDITLNGSGDIVTHRIVSQGSISVELSGSGDIDCKGEMESNTFSAELKGSGDVDVAGITSGTLQATLNGSGDLNMKCITAENLTANLSGSGDVNLSGQVIHANLSLISSGNLEADRLTCVDAECSLVGSGDLTCAPVKTLKCTIEGSGGLSYRGNPAIENLGRNKPQRI
jgi:hypothetical protein